MLEKSKDITCFEASSMVQLKQLGFVPTELTKTDTMLRTGACPASADIPWNTASGFCLFDRHSGEQHALVRCLQRASVA